MNITASSLARVAICHGSAHLPQIKTVSADSDRGTAVHAYLADCVTIGPNFALENVPDEYRELCAAFDLSRLPVCPKSFAAEITFAWNPISDAAWEVGRLIGRDYSTIAPDEIPGTPDIVGVTDDAVVIWDWKGAFSTAERAVRNLQIRAYLLFACRAYGKSRGYAGIIRLRDNGMPPSIDVAEFDEMDLDVIAYETALIIKTAEGSKELVLGPHCQYCPAIQACPAQRQNFGELASGEPLAEISAANASSVLARWQGASRVMKTLEDALKAYATIEPIKTQDGKFWGPVEETRESVDGSIARGVLANMHGSEIAMMATKMVTSKSSIEEALKSIAPKGKLAAMKRETLAAIQESGGISVSTSTSFRARVEIENK